MYIIYKYNVFLEFNPKKYRIFYHILDYIYAK